MNSGEHFYTASMNEARQLKLSGWNFEGIAWYSPTVSSQPVYRLFHTNVPKGDHYYTVSQGEVKKLEKTGWRLDNGGKPVFYSGGKLGVRVAFNPKAISGTHNYTTSSTEQTGLLKSGWQNPALAFYAERTASSQEQKNALVASFTRNGIKSGISTGLVKPNIIVIFTEGLSSEVLDGNNARQKNLTPNLDKFSKQSINVTNYFNQTAATGKGIRGQLYSAQQRYEGYDRGTAALPALAKTPLISLTNIVNAAGYNSEFINAEPKDKVWTKYLSTLGFGTVFQGPNGQLQNLDGQKALPDQANYQTLFSEAKRLSSSGKPFFLADYTFQTHAGLDAKLKFGNGKNPYLNKFYNTDNAFGKFWSAFNKSSLKNNTIVIFTADHTTFPTPEYDSTFGVKRSYFVSPMPLLIYSPHQAARTINASGQNSLQLAPTILDLAGLEKYSNTFLGTSLFSNEVRNPLVYLTTYGTKSFSTKGKTLSQASANSLMQNQDKSLLYQLNQIENLSMQ